MLIKNVLVSEIKPYEKNPRKNDSAVDKVAESIRQFGFRQPIVVAEQTGWRCNMMELDPKYVDVICMRYEEITGEKAVRIYEGQEAVSL